MRGVYRRADRARFRAKPCYVTPIATTPTPSPPPDPAPNPTPTTLPSSPVVDWLNRRDPVRWVLGGALAVWSITFIVLAWMRHDHYGTFGFDLGIYDQGVWLASRLRDPFITVRGLELFGHHMNPILLLLVPGYWLGGGPHFLLVVQVIAQASGALAVFLLARDRLGDRWLALLVALTLLLHPAYQFFVWEFFHPDALAVAPLLFAYWAARQKRWAWFAVAAVLAIACKEDVALALVMVGIVVIARRDWMIGLAICAFSIAWFGIATRWLIPAFNGIGPFYDSFFGEFGRTPGEVVKNALIHPTKTMRVATRPDRITYYRMMLLPSAFLPLAGWSGLLVGVPMLAINALSSFPYQREIRYHYAALVLAGIVLGTVEAIALLGRTPSLRRFLVGLVVVTSVATTVAMGPSPIGTKFRQGYWPFGVDARRATKQRALRVVPAGESVSAIYDFVPHLTHREKVYEFPVPWRNVNWGVHGEHLDNPAGVQWIAVDLQLVGDKDKQLLTDLLSTQFATMFNEDNILVAKRIAPGPVSPSLASLRSGELMAPPSAGGAGHPPPFVSCRHPG